MKPSSSAMLAKMKSVVGLGQIKQLLHALHVAAAREAAGSHGDQRLVDVKAGALRIGNRDGERPACAAGARQPSGATRPERAAPRQTATSRYFHSMPASISIIAVTPASTSAVPRSGWRTTRAIKTTGMMRRAQQGVLPVVACVSSRVCRNQARNRTSTGLAISEGWKVKKSAKANPAMRVVRTGNEEDQHQQHRGDAQRRIDEARRVVDGCSPRA